MLTTSRKQIVEQIIEKEGIAYRVLFAVSSELGQRKVEIVQVIPLGKIEEIKEVVSLPTASECIIYGECVEKFFKDSVISPYTSLIYINGSKPRAPTVR